MTSKRTAASKRTPLPRAADYAKSFLKDWERLSRSGRYDIGGDFLLLYKLDERATPGLLVFVRAGTHADLFEQRYTVLTIC